MIIFLYGEDSFRSTQKLNQIREKFHREKDPTQMNVHTFDSKGAAFENIKEAISSTGFFATKRLVILKDILSQKALSLQLLDYLNSNNLPEESIIVFWERSIPDKGNPLFKKLSKGKYTQKFSPLSDKKRVDWLLKESKLRGGTMTEEMAILFNQLFHFDMWTLSNELDKLIAFADGKEITKTLLSDLGYSPLEANIFDFLDHITDEKKSRLAELLSKILVHQNGLYILAMVHRQFRLLYQTKHLENKITSAQELGKKLNIHPYVARKLLRQSRITQLGIIRKKIDQLVAAELAIKTGRKSQASALGMMLLK